MFSGQRLWEGRHPTSPKPADTMKMTPLPVAVLLGTVWAGASRAVQDGGPEPSAQRCEGWRELQGQVSSPYKKRNDLVKVTEVTWTYGKWPSVVLPQRFCASSHLLK